MTPLREALRLADALDELDAQFSFPGLCGEAAAELRRLHASNQALLEALQIYADGCDASNTTPCGYSGNLCCKTARDAIKAADHPRYDDQGCDRN